MGELKLVGRVTRGGVFRAAPLALFLALSGCNPAQERAPLATTVKPPEPDWQAGRRYFYGTTLASKLSVAGASTVAFSMSAEVTLEARPAGASTEFVARVTQARFQTETPAAQQQFDQLATELDRPFGFAMTGGKLSAVRLPSAWSPFASSIARTLASAFQYVPRTDQQTGATWTAREVDSTGAFDVEYTPGSGRTIAMHKLSYASISLGKVALANFNAMVTPEVLESKGSVELGVPATGPRLASVEYREKLRTQLTPASLANSETQLALKLVRSEQPQVALDWSSALAGTIKLAADERLPTHTAPTTYDVNRIGDYTFPKALSELEAHSRDPEEKKLVSIVRGQPFEPDQEKERENKLQAEGKAFAAMAALIRRDKQDIPLVLARVRAQSPAAHALLDALSSAGTPEAQEALVLLSEDAKLKLPLRRAAAFSLTRTNPATPATVAALRAHVATSDPLHLFALFGLGTIARRLREDGETARSEAIVQGLSQDLSQVTNPDDQVDTLRAIANSGAPSAFDAVKPFLDNKDVRVQAAAIASLRLMVRPEVDGIIAAELAHPEPALQNAALDAISVREPSAPLVTAVDRAAKSATAPGVRMKAVRIMGKWLPQRPEFRSALEAVAQSDNEDQIRAAAKKALGS
jgi:hypothetical protein